MKNIPLSFILLSACALAAPSAFAQKTKGLVKAAESLAGRGAREAVRAEVSVQAAQGAAARMAAAAQEESNLHAHVIPELESALKELSRYYSARGSQNVQFLIATKVKDAQLKESLQKLVKARQIGKAYELLESRSLKVFSFPASLSDKSVASAAHLEEKLASLDFSKGPDVVYAARLLAAAREEGVLARARYVSALDALEAGRPERMFKVLRKEIPFSQLSEVRPEREAKLWSSLMRREAWNDLTPRVMTLPPVEDQIRHAAIRKVIGKRTGGQKERLPFYKEYYDKQPVWVQADLDAQIDALTQALTQAYARRIGQSRYRDEQRSFLRHTESFFSGRMQQSPSSLEYLYSPHVPAALKAELKRYMGALPQDKAGRDVFYAKAREFYDVFMENQSAGRVFPNPGEEKTLSMLQRMLTLRGVPKNTTEAVKIIDALKGSPDPLAAECARRAEAALQTSSLAAETLESLKRYVAENNALPPSTGTLYQRVLHFKNYPGQFQAQFNEIFEQYRRWEGRSPGRPRKN